MLHINHSPDWHTLHRHAIDEIVSAAKEQRGKRVLIVPEQFSFETEKALCEAGGAQISRFAEVLSFSRLAERSLALCGGIAHPVMDQGGRIMALARAVDQVRSRLQFYARSAQRGDFLLQMLSIVDELKIYRIDSARLQEATGYLEGTLAVKTQELALLLEAYEGVCAHGKQDPRDRLSLLCEHIEKKNFGKDLHIYVEGFLGFTAIELEILSKFLSIGAEVTVYLCCDNLFEGQQVFSAVRKTARQLIREADRQEIKIFPHSLPASPSPLRAAALSAFTRQGGEMCDTLRLYTCAGAQEEVASICADILHHVRNGGRFRDIAIACADEDALLPLLEAEFDRCDIPAFFAGKHPALRTPLLSAVLCALRAAAGQMEREDVLAWLKSDCAPLSTAECDILENYVLLWEFSGSQWEREFTLHPRGFGNSLEEADKALLAKLNELRQRCITPLIALGKALRRTDTVGGYVLAVYEFLQRTDFSRRVAQKIELLEKENDQNALQVTRQLYDLLIDALEQLYSVQYDAQRSPEEFLRLMEIILSQYQVGRIPAVMDAVTVGAPASLQHKSTKHLYICGCRDGCFPQIPSGGSLLNEAERNRLRELGISLAPDENEQMDRSLMGAYALLCAPSERLCLSAGSEQSAYLFQTLCRLYPECVRSHSERLSPEFATAKTFGLWLARNHSEVAAPKEAETYRDYLSSAQEYSFGTLSSPTVLGLYGNPIRLSASRIDRYASCRFAFFLRDGLKAAERKAAAFDAPIYGTFVHYVLEHTLKQVKEEGGIAQVDDKRLQAIAKTHMEAFLQAEVDPVLMESQRFSYLLRRNFVEVSEVVAVLGRELRASQFIPTDFELTFSGNGTLPPVEIATEKVRARISGAVDRVDLFEEGGHTFFRVVDYKTGKKDFDYTELLERRGLQMLIYLFALQQNGEEHYGKPIHPAGVLYVPARDEVLYLSQKPQEEDAEAERLNNHRRQGLLLNDNILLQAMEPCGNASPLLMPYKMRKDGPSGDLMDLEQLGMLRRYVNQELTELTEDIFEGTVTPNPYIRGTFGSCSYCPYQSVCHPDLCGMEARSLKATAAKEFWQRLAWKEEQHG